MRPGKAHVIAVDAELFMNPFTWTCPHCNHAQTVTGPKYFQHHEHISIDGLADGKVGAMLVGIGCSNPSCGKLTFTVRVYSDHWMSSQWAPYGTPRLSKQLFPESAAKPQPDYIPEPLREDYAEACRIRDLSPKASATLARRCLQGMIRHFCGIARKTLYDEITALREVVDEGRSPPGVTIETVDAIDHVRGIGNIGAHMEKDIDLIIPVEPDEAQHLIELIEMLFEEWYVAAQVRRDRLAKIAATAEAKKQAKLDGMEALKALPSPEVANG